MTTDAGASGAPRFDVVLRGYDRRQVDEHVARLQRVLARMRADLEVARNQPPPAARPAPVARPTSGGLPLVGPQGFTTGPQGQIGDRPRPSPRPRPDLPVPDGASPDMIGNFTGRMESILQAAEDEAAEIRNRARSEEGQVRSQLTELVRQRDAMLAELARMRGQLESLLSAPTARMTVPPQAGAAPPLPAGPPQAGLPGAGPRPARPGPGAVAPPERGTPGPGLPVPPAPQLPAGPPPGVPEQASAVDGAHGPASDASAVDRATAEVDASEAVTSEGATSEGAASEGAASEGAASEGAPSDGTASDGTAPGAQAPEPAAGTERPSSRNGGVSPRAAQGRPAAHRLASGAYSAVERTDSMRPRTESDPEPGELFRPDPRSGDATARDTAARSDQEPDDVESTVRVGAVRPAGGADPTVLAKAVAPSEPNGRPDRAEPGATADPDGGDGTGGQGQANRPATGSRSR